MSAFDKVIGYESIKNELLQICDMIHNKKIYEALGAKLPQGILLYGDPGLGKTLMAKRAGLRPTLFEKIKATMILLVRLLTHFGGLRKTLLALFFLMTWTSLPTRIAITVMQKNM